MYIYTSTVKTVPNEANEMKFLHIHIGNLMVAAKAFPSFHPSNVYGTMNGFRTKRKNKIKLNKTTSEPWMHYLFYWFSSIQTKSNRSAQKCNDHQNTNPCSSMGVCVLHGWMDDGSRQVFFRSTLNACSFSCSLLQFFVYTLHTNKQQMVAKACSIWAYEQHGFASLFRTF